MHIALPNILLLLCCLSLYVTFLSNSNGKGSNGNIFANAQEEDVVSTFNKTENIIQYGLTAAPMDIVGYTDQQKGEACKQYTYQNFINYIKLLRAEFIDILKELKAPNLMDLTSLLQAAHYSEDEGNSVEILAQFIDTVDDISRTDSIYKCAKYDWCPRLQNKVILMEKALNSIKSKFKVFGEEYMPQTFVLYPGRVKCKAPFQWNNILQALGALLHCSNICNTCEKASKYDRCEFLPVLQMWPEDKDAENGGKNNPEKPPRSKPIVLTTYPDIPLPLDGKINVPEPPSTEETNSSKPEGVSDSVQNDTLAANKTLTTNEEPEEEKSSFLQTKATVEPPPPENMLERVLSVIPLKPPDNYENTIPISVNLGGQNGIEIKGILDYLTNYDDPTSFVFDVRWEDEKRADYRTKDEKIKNTIHAGKNSTGYNHDTFHLASMGWMNAWKKINPWNGGLSQVSCPVTVKQGSKVAYTSCDLRAELSPGDHIQIRDQEFIIRPPMTDKRLLLNGMVNGESKSGVFVYKVSACFKLYGTVAVSKGSSIVTSSVDQRKVLKVGDVVEIGSEQFEVVALLDKETFSLSRTWESMNLVSADLYKCPKALNYGEELPGRCNVVKGSRVVRTTSDMTNFISPSDIIKIGVGGDSFQLVEPEDGTTLTLNRAYLGPTAEMRCFRMARSEKQRALEELAKKKLMCQSLYCLAKIEEEERAVAFTLPRELTVLNSAQWTGGMDTKEFDKQMQRTQLKAGEEKPGYIPPDDEGANTGPDDKSLGQKNAGSSHVASAGIVVGGRSNQDIDKDNEALKKKSAGSKALKPKDGKPAAPKKDLDKTQSDKAIDTEEEDDGSKMEKPKPGDDPETSKAFKKWLAKQPKVPTIKEQKEMEQQEEDARSPVTKNSEATFQKLLGNNDA